MTSTPFQTVTFTRMDSDATINLTARDQAHAQSLADNLGRKGWVLKDIVETEHEATVRHAGPTYFEHNNGLPAKRAWSYDCNCGDEDFAGNKADAVFIAKAHAPSVKVYNKNGTVAK